MITNTTHVPHQRPVPAAERLATVPCGMTWPAHREHPAHIWVAGSNNHAVRCPGGAHR